MRHGLLFLFVLQASILAAQTSPVPTGQWGDQGDGTFHNPILRADYSDPDPLRVGEDYYLVASTFEDYPGMTVLHSRDLVNWQTIGAAFTHLDQVSDDYTWRRMRRYNGGVYAPTITYHNGRYYIYANLYTDGFYMAWAERPEGPWHEQMLRDRQGRLLRVLHWTDPCPFWDDDGRAYLATSHPGREYWYSYLFQMSADGTQLLDADSAHLAQQNIFYEYAKGGGTCISPYHSSEGNRIFKRNGYYYLQHIEELAFAGGHIYAYSYIHDKSSATTDRNVKATFVVTSENEHLKAPVTMTMWMRGEPDRDVFSALSPVNREYERLPKFMPYKVDEQPVLTYVARQRGEAWTHPFLAVFEPSSADEPSEIAAVEFFTPSGKDAGGIQVTLRNGRTDYIFSAPEKTKMKYRDMKVNASYAVFSAGKLLIEQ